MRISRQESWTGLPFPCLEDLPNPGLRFASPNWQVDAFPLRHQRVWGRRRGLLGSLPRLPFLPSPPRPILCERTCRGGRLCFRQTGPPPDHLNLRSHSFHLLSLGLQGVGWEDRDFKAGTGRVGRCSCGGSPHLRS